MSSPQSWHSEFQVPDSDAAPPSTPPGPDPEAPDIVPAEAVAPPPPPPPPGPRKPAAPETHGRGVRMTIYLSGVAVMLALITWIVFLPPDSQSPSGNASDTPSADQPVEDPDPLLNADGTINPAAYQDMAARLATADGMEWRYGKDWHAYHDEKDFSELVNNPQPENKPLGLVSGDVDRSYQLGAGPPATAESLRNIQGQVGYIPNEEQMPGVDRVTSVETTDTTVGYAPRPGGRLTTDGHPEVEVSSGEVAYCADDKDRAVGNLVAMARAEGATGAAHGVMVFDTGLVATAGTSGTQGGQCLALPDGVVPTAVAVTPGNEFALITVWDTEKVKGGMAVVALGGEAGETRADWPQMYPALPSSGHVSWMKYLGTVDLPELVAPTSIGVTTDNLGDPELDRRQQWLTGADARAAAAETVAHTGRAVIASVSERKAVTVDLEPLFAGVNDAYFGEDVSSVPAYGKGASAFPKTFAKAEKSTPVVGAAVALPAAPNAVALTGERSYVATRDGFLHVLNTADVAAVAEVGTVDVGANPTCLAWAKDGGELLVTARGDRAVQWVAVDEAGGSVTRELTDARLADPLCASDLGTTRRLGEGDAAVTTVPVLGVADFGGGLVHNFRYGDASFADGTSAALPGEGFEYGGAYDPKGKPFVVSVTLDR